MKDVSFEFPQELSGSAGYGSSSITANGNNSAILLYSNSANVINYLAGTLTGCYCQFGSSQQLDGKNNATTIGIGPVGALDNDNNLLVVYWDNGSSGIEPNSNSLLAFVMARLSTGSAGGSLSQVFGQVTIKNGAFPALSMNSNGTFVEVHQNASGQLLYMTGNITNPASSSPGISFLSGASPVPLTYNGGQLTTTWDAPAIAVNSAGTVILVCQEATSNELYYCTGSLDAQNNINLTFMSTMGLKGNATTPAPSVVLTDEGDVIITFTLALTKKDPNTGASKTEVALNKIIATINPAGSLNILSFLPFTNGSTSLASLFCTMGMSYNSTNQVYTVTELTSSGNTGGTINNLQYASSYFIDRSSWMFNSLGSLSGQALRNIAVPGSHDACMYTVQNCINGADAANAQTQTLTIGKQLEAGIRYFDIRPVYVTKTKNWVTGHFFAPKGATLAGCEGPTLDTVLNDVANFLANNKELVILKFSHIDDKNRPDAEHVPESLIKTVKSYLFKYLCPTSNPDICLATQLFSTFINSNSQTGRVLPVFDGLPADLLAAYKKQGFYSFGDIAANAKTTGNLIVYDKFADENNLQAMITNQVNKMNTASDHPATGLFLLSWTLTRYSPSILAGAFTANQALWPNMVARQKSMTQNKGALMPNILYIDNCYGFVTDVAVWINAQVSP